jgi:adenylate cyclase
MEPINRYLILGQPFRTAVTDIHSRLLNRSSSNRLFGGSIALRKVSKFFSLHANSIFYRLKLSFGLFFLTPLIGFGIISYRYGFFGSTDSYYFLLSILVFSLFGFVIVRQIADGVERVAKNMAKEVSDRMGMKPPEGDEIDEIENTFRAINQRLTLTHQEMERRILEMEAIRNFRQTASMGFDRRTILVRALEQALEVSKGTGGTVFEIEKKDRASTLICRCISGEGFRIAEGEKIPVSTHPGRRVLEAGRPALLSAAQEIGWDALLSNINRQVAVIPVSEEPGFSGMAVLIQPAAENWSEEILKFFSSYFDTAAVSLKVKALGRQEQETAEDLKTVLYVLKTVNSGLSEKEMLEAVGKKLRQVIPHDWIGLALIEPGGRDLHLAHSIPGNSPRVSMGIQVPRENALFSTAMRSGEVLAVEDLSEYPGYFEKILLEEFGLRSCLFAGLCFKGECIGVVCVGNREPSAFGSAHERIFSMIADGMSLAIEQARLLAQAREKSGELEVLNRIGRALTSSTFNMDRVLTYTIEIISALINVEAGSLLLLEEDELVFKVAIGKAGEALKGFRIKMGQGIAGWVAATGEPMMVQDPTENPHFFRGLDDRTGFETRNLLCIPMIVGGKTIGTIELINKVRGNFTDEDLRILKAVATSAAIAIENSRLYGKTISIAKKERLIRNIFQKYVPEEIATEILGRGEKDLISLGERRCITLLNVDLRGYSQLAKKVSAEEVVGLLNFFFMQMGNIVLKHKGILDKYLGDGLLAIFGAPIATRNPALDAVFAAIEMAAAMEHVDKYAREHCGVPLRMGISINTGHAIVGNVGFDRKMDYTAIGRVVNETFRLQDLTREKPDCVLIGRSTYDRVKPFVHARSLGTRVLGIDEAQMEVFEITGKKEISDVDYMLYQAKLAEHGPAPESPRTAQSPPAADRRP